MTYYDAGSYPWSGNSGPTEADIARSNLQNLAESLRSEVRDLTARNAALVAALKNIRKQPRSPRGGFSGFVDRIVEMIDAALAAEERAAKAAKEGGK